MTEIRVLCLLALMILAGACSVTPSSPANSGQTNVPSNKAAQSANGTKNSQAPDSNRAANRTVGEKVESVVEYRFEPSGFPAGWEWMDGEKNGEPVRVDLKSGYLKLSVPTGRDYFGDTRNAPMLLKSLTGDFEIETKVRIDPRSSYQGAGLVVVRNGSNYLRLERAFGGTGGGESGIRFDMREDEIYEPLSTPDKNPVTVSTVELKFVRKGGEFAGFWREPGGTWREVAKTSTSYPATVHVGLIVCNTAEPIDADFEYIRTGPAK